MTELIRDTVFGHFLRKVTGNKVLLYEEEKDPSLWKKYVHIDKSANVAKHGQTSPPVTIAHYVRLRWLWGCDAVV